MSSDYPYEDFQKAGYSFLSSKDGKYGDLNNLGVVSGTGTARSPDLGDFIIDFLGPDLIRNFAQVMDPFWKFKHSNVKPSEINRERTFRICPFRERGVTSRVRVDTWRTESKPGSFYDQTGLIYYPDPSPSNTYYPSTGQPELYGFVRDSTKKLRTIGSEGNEFELFKGTLSSTSRNYTRDPYYATDVREFTGWNPERRVLQKGIQNVITRGPDGLFSKASLDNLIARERANADERIYSDSLKLLKKALPLSRETSVFRFLYELKDLPGTLKSLTENAIARIPVKERVSGQYLNYQFGINPLVQDLLKLSTLPTAIAKKVNYLIARRGLATTFKSSYRMIEGIENPPGFAYDVYGTEASRSTFDTVGSRSINMRLVVNANVDFPAIATPALTNGKITDVGGLKAILASYYSGAIPSLTDLYNILPWTWLEDWFSGLSDYLSCIEMINMDNTVVNWGYITYECKGELRSTYEADYEMSKATWFDDHWINENSKKTIHASSTLRYKYTRRKSLGGTDGVKTMTKPETLDPFRATIASALLLQNTAHRK